MIHERVTLYFKSIVEGDHWNATASGTPGGSWAVTTVGDVPLDGPLIVTQTGDLTATGSFHHETREETLEGNLNAHCGD